MEVFNMSGISMQKRLEIDCKKVKAMEERKADLLAEIARIDAEIKARRISIDYNTKRWNEKNPNNLWDMNLLLCFLYLKKLNE